MRNKALAITLIAAGTASAVRGEVRVVDAAEAQLHSAPTLIARLDPPSPTERYAMRAHFRFGRSALIRTVAGGVDASPFVTALPGQMWHGRLRSFGAANGVGFSGIAVRAKAVDFGGLSWEKHASGFLASELRYGIVANEDDFLTVNLNAVSQRMPALQTIGVKQSIRVGSFYFGASLVHERKVALSAGVYQVKISNLSPLDYSIERSAGMPPAGRGIRLGCDWRLGQAGAPAPARIALEYRNGDADRDRLLALGPESGREQRLLLRFTEPF